MPGYEGPRYVNMCSARTPEEFEKRVQECRSVYGATETDVVIKDLRDADPFSGGIKSHFRLEYMTYRGWKVYQLLTGCLASDPGYEKAHPEEVPVFPEDVPI